MISGLTSSIMLVGSEGVDDDMSLSLCARFRIGREERERMRLYSTMLSRFSRCLSVDTNLQVRY
jgi:hypothetical protein